VLAELHVQDQDGSPMFAAVLNSFVERASQVQLADVYAELQAQDQKRSSFTGVDSTLADMIAAHAMMKGSTPSLTS
jgi:hypothetical protein